MISVFNFSFFLFFFLILHYTTEKYHRALHFHHMLPKKISKTENLIKNLREIKLRRRRRFSVRFHVSHSHLANNINKPVVKMPTDACGMVMGSSTNQRYIAPPYTFTTNLLLKINLISSQVKYWLRNVWRNDKKPEKNSSNMCRR